MSWRGFWRVSVLIVLLAALGFGACLTGLAEAASHSDQVCAGKEIGSCKMSGPHLSAVPVDRSPMPGSLSQGRCSLPVLASDLVAADLLPDLSSRAPPLL